jgi:hypothetical protein
MKLHLIKVQIMLVIGDPIRLTNYCIKLYINIVGLVIPWSVVGSEFCIKNIKYKCRII